MRPLQVLFLAFLLFATAESIHAAACVPALLSVYDVPSFTCDFGPFTLKDFTFTLGPTVGSPATVSDSGILVTPTTASLRYGLSFSSAGWSVTSGQKVTYFIVYTWDPGPIRSLEEVMNDPPTGAGSSTVKTDACLGGAWVGCLFPMTSVTVSDPGSTSNSVSFTPPLDGIVGVQHTITMDATGGGTADILSFGSTAVIPEPGTMVGGLLALALTIAKLRAKRF
jgi:hypothetical protein